MVWDSANSQKVPDFLIQEPPFNTPFSIEADSLHELPYPLNDLAKAYLGARDLRASRPNDATLEPNEAQQVGKCRPRRKDMQ